MRFQFDSHRFRCDLVCRAMNGSHNDDDDANESARTRGGGGGGGGGDDVGSGGDDSDGGGGSVCRVRVCVCTWLCIGAFKAPKHT